MDHYNPSGTCRIHDDLPILFYCTDPKCNTNNSIQPNNSVPSKHLCEICLNLHDKSHKFIISSNSIFDETYEKMINSNIEKASKIKANIEKLNKIFAEQINKEFKSFTDKLLILIEKSKADLINTLELQKNKAFDEIEIWKDLKIKMEKFSLYNLKTIKPGNNNLNMHLNVNFDNSIEIDDSKFIQELNFLGCDKRNNSNTDLTNLSCLSKDENINNNNIINHNITKDNFNFNSNLHPSLINVNNLNSNNNHNNLFYTNFNTNNNLFLENKLKIISLILEKHIEQFVNCNFANNPENNNNNNEEANKDTSGNGGNNSLKFTQNVKNIFRSFSADLNFKLKSLLEHNLPLAAYAANSGSNTNINGTSPWNNSNNNLNTNKNSCGIPASRNNNGVYSNVIRNLNMNNNNNNNNNNQELRKSDSTKQIATRPIRSDLADDWNSETLNPNDNVQNNNVNFSPCDDDNNKNNLIKNKFDNVNNLNNIMDKNVAAYGSKRFVSNERDTFIFDANGGEYSPKNSMILNFHRTNTKKDFELDTLISTREIKNKISNSENINTNNENKNKSPEIDLLQEMRSDSVKNINTNLKKTEDTYALENFQLKRCNKIIENNDENENNSKQQDQKKAKPVRAPSVKGSAYTSEANNPNTKNSMVKKNSNTPNVNPIKTFDDEDKKLNNNKNNNQNQNRNHIPRTNNLRSVSNVKRSNFDKNSPNDLLYKNILENKNINSVLTNIREKSLNILPNSNANIKNIKYPSSNNISGYCLSENNNKEIVNLNIEKEDVSCDEPSENENIENENLRNYKAKSKSKRISNNLIENFNHKSFELAEPEDILTSKKGSWYSLDYIESHDYLVCGFENGEIVLFKASDYSLIRTYRPRFKRIRKLLYSPENSSVFVCYDDGFFIVINILDLKFESYKKSENQIYTFDIMKNYNILIWGGYDKKIMFSPINNLDTTQLFWESKHGEIQAIYHDLGTDVLIASFRKNKVAFFNFKNTQIIKQFSIEENDDACGMVITKYEADFNSDNNLNNENENDNNEGNKIVGKSTILISGFFMCIHQFEITVTQDNQEKVDFIRYIRTPYTHIYDILFLNERYFLISTFEEGKIVLLDFEDNKIIKVFEHFYKAVLQIKYAKGKFYLTSHGDYLKKVEFDM